MLSRLSVFLFFILFGVFSLLFGSTSSANELDLTGRLLYLQDHGQKLTIQTVSQPVMRPSFKTALTSNFNFGNTKSAFWLKIEPGLSLVETDDYILEIQYGKIGVIELYFQEGTGNWKLKKQGIYTTSEKREPANRNFIFALNAGSLKKPIYLKVHEGYLRLNLRLWKQPQFIAKEQQVVFFDGLFYGIVFLVLLLNLFFYYFVRDRTLVHYAVFLLCISLFFLSGQGWLDVILSIRGSSFVRIQTAFFGVLLTIFGTLFTRSYLKLDEHSPEISRILRFFQFFFPGMAVLALLVLKFQNQSPGRGTFGTGLLIVLLVLILCLVAAIQGVREKREIAIYYFVATTLFILLAIVQILSSLQILPIGLYWRFLQWGTVIEMVIFSFGLSRYYRQLQMQRSRLQTDLLNKEKELVKQLGVVNELKDQILSNVIDPKLFPELGRIASVASSILYIQAFGNTSEIYYQDADGVKEMYLDCSLQNLETYFGNDFLLRIHKSYLINPKAKFNLQRRSSADYDLVFGKFNLPVGRKFVKQIKGIYSKTLSVL
jgi:two-component system, sensor histidine kinase LadS